MRLSLLFPLLTVALHVSAWAEFRLATFSADVTVPIGHGMMGGSWKATQVVDPLFAKGIVLMAGGRTGLSAHGDVRPPSGGRDGLRDDTAFPPVVYVVLDWCEIRNDALERWRSVLAGSDGKGVR